MNGNGHRASFAYDAHDRVIEIRPPDAAAGRVVLHYNANGNVTEKARLDDRRLYIGKGRDFTSAPASIREQYEYNSLNSLIRHTVVAGEAEKTTVYARDDADDVIRRVTPTGGIVEYRYDQRGLLTELTVGENSTRYAYTLNGTLASTTDGLGHRLDYSFDGFERCTGVVYPDGTVKRQSLDALGNVTRLAVESGQQERFCESFFEYDELSRLIRMDRTWRDPSSGELLGSSNWDGRAGMVSTIAQYDAAHQPTVLWTESGNVVSLGYDGAMRLRTLSDSTGESVSFGYDQNNNPVMIERLGPPPPADIDRLHIAVEQQFDVMDRLVARKVAGQHHVTFAYDALGNVVERTDGSGATSVIPRDAFGRPAGRVRLLGNGGEGGATGFADRLSWDASDRLVAWTNPSGHRMTYRYDDADRLMGVVFADGTAQSMRRDACGNVVRFTGADGAVTVNFFDELNRLVARETPHGDVLERFHYDGLGRIVEAVADGISTECRYDSLSRLLAETGRGGRTAYQYDAAGNCVRLTYPSGREVHRTFDAINRVIDVADQTGPIAHYRYSASTRRYSQRLGEHLEATFSYTRNDLLEGVSYRRHDTGEIVESSVCRYDGAGKLIHEERRSGEEAASDQFTHDGAGRLVQADYDGNLLSTAGARLPRSVSYELTPAGLIRMKTTTTVEGAVDQQVASATMRERYVSFGGKRFNCDAAGNRTEESDENGQSVRYRYDQLNRLRGVDRRTADGTAETVEYSYDAFGRPVGKRVSRGGDSEQYLLVWDGDRLIEVHESGALASSFIYGNRAEPLKMYRHGADHPDGFFYLMSVGGDVAGLYDAHAGVLERYRYDVNGLPVGQSDASFQSRLGNPFLARAALWDNHIQCYLFGGNVFDAATGQNMNVSSAFLAAPMPVRSDFWEPGFRYSDTSKLEVLFGIGMVGLGIVIAGPVGLGIGIAGAIFVIDGAAGSPMLKGAKWIFDELGITEWFIEQIGPGGRSGGTNGSGGRGNAGLGNGASSSGSGGEYGSTNPEAAGAVRGCRRIVRSRPKSRAAIRVAARGVAAAGPREAAVRAAAPALAAAPARAAAPTRAAALPARPRRSTSRCLTRTVVSGSTRTPANPSPTTTRKTRAPQEGRWAIRTALTRELTRTGGAVSPTEASGMWSTT